MKSVHWQLLVAGLSCWRGICFCFGWPVSALDGDLWMPFVQGIAPRAIFQSGRDCFDFRNACLLASAVATAAAPQLGPDPAAYQQAVGRAIEYFEQAQGDDGSYSKQNGIGVTALVANAADAQSDGRPPIRSSPNRSSSWKARSATTAASTPREASTASTTRASRSNALMPPIRTGTTTTS